MKAFWNFQDEEEELEEGDIETEEEEE